MKRDCRTVLIAFYFGIWRKSNDTFRIFNETNMCFPEMRSGIANVPDRMGSPQLPLVKLSRGASTRERAYAIS